MLILQQTCCKIYTNNSIRYKGANTFLLSVKWREMLENMHFKTAKSRDFANKKCQLVRRCNKIYKGPIKTIYSHGKCAGHSFLELTHPGESHFVVFEIRPALSVDVMAFPLRLPLLIEPLFT